jgi:sirohydrochlorin cobaltochelatase
MTTPLVIIGHGTRSRAGVAQFAALVQRVRDTTGAPEVVEGGFIELSPPPVRDAVAAVVAAGYRQVAAVPLVLAAAGHGKGDIPAALGRERERHPGFEYRYGRPLGPHPVLQDVVAARVDAALGLPVSASGEDRVAGRDGVHVVLVGRGSTDPDANAEVAKVARLLYEGRGYAAVESAFVSLAEPPGRGGPVLPLRRRPSRPDPGAVARVRRRSHGRRRRRGRSHRGL